MTADAAAATTEEGTSKGGGGGTTKEDAQYGGGDGKLHGCDVLRMRYAYAACGIFVWWTIVR